MLLLQDKGLAQQKDFKSISDAFQFYKDNFLIEKIYAHIDRPTYLAGETMWFKLYYTEGSGRVIDASKVGYVEILGENNEVVLQSIVPFDVDGMGHGYFELPATLKSGHYIFRAYTNWMKNFDPEFYFQERVSIINPFIALTSSDSKGTKKYDVQFFPEGGNLIYGLPSRVAFRVVNQEGKGVDFSGVILDSDNDTITVFSPHKFGLGSFTFIPQRTSTYRAIIRFGDGELMTYEIPEPLETGYTLQVNDTNRNMISVKVYSKVNSGTNVYLFAHAKHIVKVTQVGIIRNNQCLFLLDRNQLGDGIIHLTVFNDQLFPVCERLYFNGISKELLVNVEVDKPDYKSREKVIISIMTTDSLGEPIKSNLSVAVYKIDSLVDTEHQTITTYLKITSDLAGNIENPGFYFEGDNSIKHREAIDNLMLTHGWRRFRWKSILGEEYKIESLRHIVELRGHLIRGVLSKEESEEPISGAHVYFSVPHIQQSGISKTNDNGEFLFDVRYYGKRKIVLQTDQPQHVKLLSPYSTQFSNNYQFSELSLKSDVKIRLNARSIYSQVHNAFTKGAKQIQMLDQAVLPFFGQPEREYLLDDYTRFPTLEEVLREYVPEIAVRKNKGVYKQVVIDPSTNLGFINEPFILLDGTPILDVNRLMNIDPRQIRALQVVNKKYFYAGLSFDGLISYTSYNSDLGGYEITSGIMTEYEIFNAEREFFSPVYDIVSKQTSQVPDTRTLLYWNPDVKVKQDGAKKLEFFSSDLSGTFKVVIHGITSQGFTGSTSITFNVIRIK